MMKTSSRNYSRIFEKYPHYTEMNCLHRRGIAYITVRSENAMSLSTWFGSPTTPLYRNTPAPDERRGPPTGPRVTVPTPPVRSPRRGDLRATGAREGSSSAAARSRSAPRAAGPPPTVNATPKVAASPPPQDQADSATGGPASDNSESSLCSICKDARPVWGMLHQPDDGHPRCTLHWIACNACYQANGRI